MCMSYCLCWTHDRTGVLCNIEALRPSNYIILDTTKIQYTIVTQVCIINKHYQVRWMACMEESTWKIIKLLTNRMTKCVAS